MRRFLAIGLWLGACGGDDGPTGPITARITHYDYAFDIDTREATAKLTASIEVGGDCLALPFRGKGLVAEGMKIDGAAMRSVSVADGTITMCGAGYDAGTEVTFESQHEIPMETLGPSQVGYSVTNDAAGNPFYYLVSWVGGCDRFGPCDNRPDQFAAYTFRVTHPAGFTARCSGAITEVSPTETLCEFTADGGPTYSTFGVAVYPAWVQTPKGTWGSVDVTVYDRAGVIEQRLDSAYHGGFVAFMESNFGPYPFGREMRILTAPTYWSGFEHPGNIVLDDRLNSPGSRYADPVAHVTDHEIAHQWAGDQTTLADTYDFVWKEAMAEYLSYVYEDSVDPAVGAATALAWKAFSSGARFFPVPGEKPELFDYYGDVYGPGPLIFFRQLEVLTSRDQVMAALKMVLGTPRALSVDELLAALETTTGLALADYAAAWIHGEGAPEWPEVTATFTPGANGTSSLRVMQTAALARTCKFHVALAGANPGERVEVEVDTFRNGTDQTLDVATPAFTVTQTIIDPRAECLVFASGANATARAPEHHPWRSGHLAPATH
jgi:aminopeptidase N